MSKGITVVDIPEYCDYCPNGRIFGINSAVECLVAPEGTCVSGHGLHVKRPDWCPIKVLPIRLEEINCPHSMSDYQRKGFSRGWNACLDEIEGN